MITATASQSSPQPQDAQPRDAQPQNTQQRSAQPRPAMGGLEPNSPEAELFAALRPLRRQLATERGVPPYIVLSDAGLADLVRLRPANPQVLSQVKGIGPAKLETFGPALLAAVRQESSRLGLDLTEVPAAVERKPRAATTAPIDGQLPREAMRPLANAAFARGDSLGDICVTLGRAPGGLVELLIAFIADNGLATLEPWLSDQALADIEVAATDLGWARLNPIHAALGGAVPYPLLRLAQGFLLARGAPEL